MNIQKLDAVISEFEKKKKSNTAYYEENWMERKKTQRILSVFQ